MENPDDLFQLLGLEDVPTVVDVGANPIDEAPPYKGMLQEKLCRVIGFEPQTDALNKLNAKKGGRETYLPHAIGSGSDKTLHICRASGMTSMLEPSPTHLSVFSEFPQLGEVVETVTLPTKRLDDIPEINRMDYLKIDVQGSELEIFGSAKRLLQDTVVIHTEVSFLPLYKDQPSFGEVDVFLRSLGFIPHAMASLKLWPIAPLVLGNDPRRPLNQLMEADLVYVRNFIEGGLNANQLKMLAYIAHHCYNSFDLATRCILTAEEQGALRKGTTVQYLSLAQKKLNGIK